MTNAAPEHSADGRHPAHGSSTEKYSAPSGDGCSARYPAAVIDIWCAAPAPASLPLLVQAVGAVVVEETGREQLESMACERSLPRLFLSASLNTVPFYERAGFLSLREALYRHRCSVDLKSVFIETQLRLAS